MRIGTDLCDSERIKKIYEKFGDKFLDRILTPKEKAYVLSGKKLLFHRLAGRYAAKEAVAKLLGTGIGSQLSFQDIEILRTVGTPVLSLNGRGADLAKTLGLKDWSLSISHERKMVIAVVIAN